ncbi:MAG: PDZ domain-containing protein [Acidobacteria bacterium]|nr:MAG: PDZ domain-containing protein [Acidobacteriota bacterium]
MPSSRFSGLYVSGRTFALLIVIVGVVGAMAFYRAHTGTQDPEFGGITSSTEPALQASQVPALITLSKEQEMLAQRVEPAVVAVNVTARNAGEGDEMGGEGGELSPNNPLSQFFGQFGRQFPQRRPRFEQGLGSGIIISPDGYIVTNNHVVKGATNIRVTLTDRREFKARIVGMDELTDLAVIKIEATGLSNLPWGDSKALKQGDPVFAFGNPFQLNFTMTHGIVSGIGRRPAAAISNLRQPSDYIQTDAAINPGNSGGPLVNVLGQVVGVNSFIFTSTGSFSGESFAIPSRIARQVTEDLIKNGKVVRGFLGISIEDVTPELSSFFHVPPTTQGALVTDVTAGDPGANAGLKNGDVIVKFSGQPVDSSTELQLLTEGAPPGTKVKLGILRNGRPMTLEARLGNPPGAESRTAQNGTSAQPAKGAHLGVRLQTLTAQDREQHQIPPNIQGALITGVVPGGPAYNTAQIIPGEVITSVNRVPTATAEAVMNELEKLPPDQAVLLRVYIGRSGSLQAGGTYVLIHPEPAGGSGGPGGGR